MFNVRAVEKWIATSEPEEVDSLLWMLRMHAHYNCDGFSDYSSKTVKTTKAEREKELREATKRGKAMAKESRINRKAAEVAAELRDEAAAA
ncbi:hypothetical protein [Corynebacterium sp.]|uniref:hypothetical protein n=1 Tax=Corynebacterium sp. TaxID=1720 RepID=UPI003734F95F